MDTKQVGERLVELCRAGNHEQALDELYADDIVSVEAAGSPDGSMPAELRGIEAVRGKNEWWTANHEVHSSTADGPYPHQNRFGVKFTFDITSKEGPRAGQRFTMQEIAIYTVGNGKIVREEFFYST